MHRKIHAGAKRGSALILILSLVVILALLAALILTRATLNRRISSSSAGQQKADQLAQGALQEILNDCRQEIAAGSRTLPANSATYNSQNVYLPNSNQTVVPAFAGLVPTPTAASDPFPNLLKRSAYNTSFFPATNATLYNATQYPPSNLASPLNTGTAASIDGRSISNTRWNLPMLMDPGQLSTLTAPDWTLVTRSGPKAFAAWNPAVKNTTDSSNYVIGRYAYMIYDEGGLLDANTAGCATSLTTDFDKSAKRGRLGQSDLTALPGLTQADIDKIVLWRNATTANAASNPAQSYFAYLFHGLFSGAVFQYSATSPIDPTAAFTTTINGDQAFTSRQDLLNFFTFTFGAGTTPQSAALQYLGTFARELNQPSYCPPNPGNNPATVFTAPTAAYMYGNNAETVGSINRDFPSVKFANAGTLSDGTTVVKAGDPLVRRRFALSRLQLIANKIANPNDTTNDMLIHNYFGLIYSASSGKWTYTSPDGSSVATSIKTLDQVAQVSPPREPDFFELLQAGILNGSLGKTVPLDLKGHSSSGSETVQYDKFTDTQVIQIGANIIDQSGADPIPTTITYGGSGSDIYDIYGVGNMPYISKINQVIYRAYVPAGQTDPNGYGNPYATPTHPTPPSPWFYPNVSAWLQFELWNPHQNPEAGPSLPLRVYAVGTAGVVVFNPANADGSNANNGGDEWAPWPGNTTGSDAVAYGLNTFTSAETITVPASAYAIADDFREPQVLTSSLGVSVSLQADHLQQTTSFGSWDFIGLKTGDAFAPSYTAEDPEYGTNDTEVRTGGAMNPFYAGVMSPTSGGITFYLQCEYPAGSGNWKTIQRVKNCIIPCDTNTPLPSSWLKCLQADQDWLVPSHSLTSVQANSKTLNTKSAYRMLPDPRTDRFGVFEGYREDPAQSMVGPSFNETVLPSTLGNATRGLLGYDWAKGRMRIPSTYSYLSCYGGPLAVAYTANGWYDGVALNYRGWQNYPGGVWAGLLNVNRNAGSISGGVLNGVSNSFVYYYADNDGIIRGGDGYEADGGDHDANGYVDGYGAEMGTAVGKDRPERPLLLNRPFRSVGELGYVHRGEPWKSLDFFTQDSADAGLLDLFSIDDEDVVAGTVDLNTRQAPVLQAILQGEAKNELATSASASGDPAISTTDASTLASLLVTERLNTSSQTGPLANRSELVTRFLGQATSNSLTALPLNKMRREAVVRPLAAVGNTRTWNLLIDVIAQSGRYPQSATDLTQFQIEGEKRYWWHVAIDRFTGQIVASRLEPVYE